jgi:hypothetical protein
VSALQQVTTELLALGVKPENIYDDALRAADVARSADEKLAGSKLLGVATGTPEFAECLLRRMVRNGRPRQAGGGHGGHIPGGGHAHPGALAEQAAGARHLTPRFDCEHP